MAIPTLPGRGPVKMVSVSIVAHLPKGKATSTYRLKATATLEKVLSAWSTAHGVDVKNVIFTVGDRRIAWHAGKSRWKKFVNLNDNSIGIELVNKGHQFGYQNFSMKQIHSLTLLCKNLKKKYSLKEENFLGHSDIAPLRKIDPGEKFPWKKLSSKKIGKWYRKKKININFDKKKMKILFFKNLTKLGYRHFNACKNNNNNIKVIKSFQRHYLPNNVTGVMDRKTYEISYFLTK